MVASMVIVACHSSRPTRRHQTGIQGQRHFGAGTCTRVASFAHCEIAFSPAIAPWSVKPRWQALRLENNSIGWQFYSLLGSMQDRDAVLLVFRDSQAAPSRLRGPKKGEFRPTRPCRPTPVTSARYAALWVRETAPLRVGSTAVQRSLQNVASSGRYTAAQPTPGHWHRRSPAPFRGPQTN